jgi:hypothetical protein
MGLASYQVTIEEQEGKERRKLLPHLQNKEGRKEGSRYIF